MVNILEKFIGKNSSLSKNRAKIVASFCASCALTYHIVIFFVFILLRITPMVYYNVFSVILFTLVLIRIQSASSFVSLYALCTIEVIPHQILSDYFLGTYANFHFFILLMGLIPFLVFRNKSKLLIPFSFVTSLLFIVIENIQFQPKYEVDEFIQVLLRIANVSLSIGIIFFMILIFTFIVENYESELRDRNQTLTSEIELAAVIQQNFFKQDLSMLRNLEIACYNKPMAGVSGDVFDFYKTGDNLDGFGVFDISGHGISSGLVTMLVKNIINKEFYDHLDLPLWEIMGHINERVIEEKGDIQNYLTGVLVRFKRENELEIVSAGHPMPVIYHHETGKCELLRQDINSIGAIGIAGFPVLYNSIFARIKTDDEVILYSDGVTDALNEERESFGIDAFMQTIEAYADQSVQRQAEEIAHEIELFRGEASQNDDLTFVILKKR